MICCGRKVEKMPVTELEIFEIDLATTEDVVSSVRLGLTIDDSGERPVVELFALAENGDVSLTDHLFEITPSIRNQYFPDTDITDINWRMTSGVPHVDINFIEVDGQIVGANFNSGIPRGFSDWTIEELNTALNSPEGFDAHYSAAYGGRYDNYEYTDSASLIAIPISDGGNDIAYIQHRDTDTELVLVDTDTFIRDWHQSDRANFGDSYVDGNIARVSRHRDTHGNNFATKRIESAPEAPEVYYKRGDERGVFVESKRETALRLAQQGAPFIPVRVKPDRVNITAFKNRYEYGRETRITVPNSEELLHEVDARQQNAQIADTAFPLPSDAEISAMLGGIPVTSYRPEDFPHLRPSIFEGFNSWEYDERIRSVDQFLTRFSFATSNGELNLAGVAEFVTDQRLAAVTTFRSVQGAPQAFALYRPSSVTDPSLRIANATRLPVGNVLPLLPAADSQFIDTFHEIGHMYAKAHGMQFESIYYEEFYADSFALTKYLEAGGSEDVVKDYIVSRALSGFLRQPDKYWFADTLADRFLEGNQDAQPNWDKAVLVNSELRLRVMDAVKFGGSLSEHSSQQIQEALALYYDSSLNHIEDPILREIIPETYPLRNSPMSFNDGDKAAVFAALGDILVNPNIDHETLALGEMVIEGGRSFTPTLLPEHLQRTAINENRIDVAELSQTFADADAEALAARKVQITADPDSQNLDALTNTQQFSTEDGFNQYIEVKDPPARFTGEKYNALGIMGQASNRDGRSVLDMQEDPGKIYRTIVSVQLQNILDFGRLVTPAEAGIRGKNKVRQEDGSYVGRDTLQFYRGHASSRYGNIVIEAPDRPFTNEEIIIHIADENGIYHQHTIAELQLNPPRILTSTNDAQIVKKETVDVDTTLDAAAPETTPVPNIDLEGGRIAAKAGLALAPLDLVNRFRYVSRAVDQGDVGMAAKEVRNGALALSAAVADYISLKSARPIPQIAGRLSLPLVFTYGFYETRMGIALGDTERALNGSFGTSGAVAGSIIAGRYAMYIPHKWGKAAFMLAGGIGGAILGADLAKGGNALLFADNEGGIVSVREMYDEMSVLFGKNGIINPFDYGVSYTGGVFSRGSSDYKIYNNPNIDPEKYPNAYLLYEQLSSVIYEEEKLRLIESGTDENKAEADARQFADKKAISLMRQEYVMRLHNEGELGTDILGYDFIGLSPDRAYNPAESSVLMEVLDVHAQATAALFQENAIALHAAVTFGGDEFSINAYHILNNLWHDRGDTEKIAEMVESNPHIGLLLERHEAALEGITVNEDGDVIFADETSVSALLGDIEEFAQRYSLELTDAERTALIGDDFDSMDENTFFQAWVSAIEELGVEIDGDVARELEKMRDILDQEGNVLANENEASDNMDALFDAAKSLSQVLSSEFSAKSVAESLYPEPRPIMVFGKNTLN